MLDIFKKPIIGIVSRVDSDSDGDKVICIMEDYRRAIIKKNAIPFLILPPQDIEYDSIRPRDVERLSLTEKEYLKDMVDMCDGILIPGGHKWYEYDEYIYEYAYSKDIPILGICAGMQMMACIDNDRLPDITIKNETEMNHHQKTEKYVHDVEIIENSFLNSIVDISKMKVNSRHNYHISKVNHLKISALSEDGLIEAVEDPNKKFVLGVQWHPESMLEYDEYANKIFDKLIKCCKKS